MFLYLLGIIWIILIINRFMTFFGNEDLFSLITSKSKKRNRREQALLNANGFLKTYRDPFGELCLSNKNCSLTYESGKSLFVFEKILDEYGGRRAFVAKNFEVLDIDEIWDILCSEFDYTTTAQDILLRCSGNTFDIKDVYIPKDGKLLPKGLENEGVINLNIQSKVMAISNDLIDVNSCTEADLTALPGVNVVMAKKAVKFREEKGSFASVDEFLAVLAIKPHFAEQIKDKIVANEVEVKKKSKVKVKRERILDI